MPSLQFQVFPFKSWYVSLQHFLLPVFNWVTHLFIIEFCCWCVYILDTLLLRYTICKYFLSFCGLFLICLTVAFKAQVFNFDEIQFTYFSSVACALVMSKKAVPNSESERFKPMTSFKSLRVLALIFGSLIHS